MEDSDSKAKLRLPRGEGEKRERFNVGPADTLLLLRFSIAMYVCL